MMQSAWVPRSALAELSRWYEGFGDTIHSYLIGLERFSIRDVLERFDKHAQSIYTQANAALLDSVPG